ncbi:hypothetical protein ACFQ0M_48660 [Kitasatospora aburaviensis]|uniref:Uncharacterized protein n=1 Tax=Kitasatospora aburaviensis TaxID=67265 RepID=A0ABW1F495_9ACTN
MARIVFDAEESAGLHAAAAAEFPAAPALAYVLERLASEGIDLDGCVPWETLRAEAGLTDDGGAQVA